MWVPLLGACLVAYFGYHVVAGKRSVLELGQLHHNIEKHSTVLAQLNKDEQRLRGRVLRMRPQSLDRDLAEEQIYRVLGYVQPDDYVLLD